MRSGGLQGSGGLLFTSTLKATLVKTNQSDQLTDQHGHLGLSSQFLSHLQSIKVQSGRLYHVRMSPQVQSSQAILLCPVKMSLRVQVKMVLSGHLICPVRMSP